MENKDLSLTKRSSLPINEIKTYSDLLVCRSIVQRKAPKECKAYIHLELMKLAMRLDMELSSDRAKLLTEDIYGLYQHESLEDIKLCFERGSRGEFGKHYNKLSMPIIGEWMKEHLTDKAGVLNAKVLSEHQGTLHDWKNRGEYLQAAKIGDLVQEGIKKKKESGKRNTHKEEMNEAEYKNYKSEYLKNQKKQTAKDV